jgi:gliding motility-associated-like protein
MRIRNYIAISLCFLSFTATAQYTLQGNAVSVGGSCYQLTEAVVDQVGAVWYDETIDLAQPFDLQFKMNFGTNSGNGSSLTPGADGMVFVMQTIGPSAIGNAGDGIGYEGFLPSLGIEFDTYWNEGNGDLLDDHIGIIKDGSVSHLASTAIAGPVTATSIGADIEDGLDHAIQITWDPNVQEINVYFDCEFRLVASIDLINDVFSGEAEVTWGFTSSTGGAFNTHTVCLYENATPTGDVTLCPGQSTQLISGGDLSQPFTWTPTDFLSDPNAYDPIATPPSTQVYTVTYTDFCGDSQSQTIEVFVEPLEVDISADFDVIDCINTTVILTANSNFDEDLTYNWSASNGGNFLSSEEFGAVIDNGGLYTVNVSFDDGACTAEDTYNIELDTLSFSADAGLGGVINCDTPTIVLLGESNDEGAEFVWSTSDGDFFGSSNVAEPTAVSAGTYNLLVTNPENGCTSEDEAVVLEDLTTPVIDIGFAEGMISCETPQIFILGTEITPDTYTNEIEWTWVEGEGGLLDPTSLEPVAALPGEYTLTVTFSENGCATTFPDFVTVEQDENAFVDISNLTMPNVITPNGDYYNDYLKPFLADQPSVETLSVLDEYNLIIYNRWGDLVFANNGLPLAWDGRANGDQLSSGSYVIVVDYKSLCGEVQAGSYTGPLEILYETP